MRKSEIYQTERDNGLHYQEIAAKYGVSYQAVAQACAPTRTKYFQPVRDDVCVYAGLRDWMNTNKVGIRALTCLAYGDAYAERYCAIRNVVRGISVPKKTLIDKLLGITGMPYEQLFREG